MNISQPIDLNKWQSFHNTPTKVGNSYFAVELNFLLGTRIVDNLEYAWTLKTKIARCQQESKSQKGISDSQHQGYMGYENCLALHKITLLKLLGGQLIVPLAGQDLLLDHLLQLQVTVITSQLKTKI